MLNSRHDGDGWSVREVNVFAVHYYYRVVPKTVLCLRPRAAGMGRFRFRASSRKKLEESACSFETRFSHGGGNPPQSRGPECFFLVERFVLTREADVSIFHSVGLLAISNTSDFVVVACYISVGIVSSLESTLYTCRRDRLNCIQSICMYKCRIPPPLSHSLLKNHATRKLENCGIVVAL